MSLVIARYMKFSVDVVNTGMKLEVEEKILEYRKKQGCSKTISILSRDKWNVNLTVNIIKMAFTGKNAY